MMRILLIIGLLFSVGCVSQGVAQNKHQSVAYTSVPNWFSPSVTIADHHRCHPTQESVGDVCENPEYVETVMPSQPGIFASVWAGFTRMLGMGAVGAGLALSGNDTNVTQQGGGATASANARSKAHQSQMQTNGMGCMPNWGCD